MRIEKRYNLESKKEWEIFEEDIRNEKVGVTDSEIVHKMYYKNTNFQKTDVDINKIQHFKQSYTKAMFMARLLNMDIIVEQNNTLTGKIILTAPCLLLDSSFEKEVRSIFYELTETADHLLIRPDGNMVKITFEFDLSIAKKRL